MVSQISRRKLYWLVKKYESTPKFQSKRLVWLEKKIIRTHKKHGGCNAP